MKELKNTDKYVFPEFARGTFVEYLEIGRRDKPIIRSQTSNSFWHILANIFK